MKPASMQLPLFNPGYPPGFLRWSQDNEHIVKAFIGLARRAQRRGMRRWSADAICHVLRFQTEWRERSASGFKVDNNNVRWLALLAIDRCPQLRGFFEVRGRAPDQATR